MTHRCKSFSGMLLDMNMSLNKGMERAYERLMKPLHRNATQLGTAPLTINDQDAKVISLQSMHSPTENLHEHI